MTKIIETGITEDILKGNEYPQLKIGNRLYNVNNKKSTYNKIQAVYSNKELAEEEQTKRMFEYAFGEENATEILNMDLPVEYFNRLNFCIMGAITGEDPKELEKEARKQKN